MKRLLSLIALLACPAYAAPMSMPDMNDDAIYSHLLIDQLEW